MNEILKTNPWILGMLAMVLPVLANQIIGNVGASQIKKLFGKLNLKEIDQTKILNNMNSKLMLFDKSVDQVSLIKDQITDKVNSIDKVLEQVGNIKELTGIVDNVRKEFNEIVAKVEFVLKEIEIVNLIPKFIEEFESKFDKILDTVDRIQKRLGD